MRYKEIEYGRLRSLGHNNVRFALRVELDESDNIQDVYSRRKKEVDDKLNELVKEKIKNKLHDAWTGTSVQKVQDKINE